MTITAPPVWPTTSYIRPVRPETGGQMASTHLAELVEPSGKACRGYVKHFPVTEPFALFNEWFGHTVMSGLGIPQPVCALLYAPVFGAPTPTAGWAFVSCEPRPSFDGTPKEIYNIRDAVDLDTLKKRLFDCPLLPLLIAADQVLINADRNLGNLIFTGKKTFAAIDHGEILGGGNRAADYLLRPTDWATSKLIEKLVDIDKLKLPFKNAILASAQVVEQRIYECQLELRDALECTTLQATSIAMDAIWWRCLSIDDWFKKRLQLVS